MMNFVNFDSPNCVPGGEKHTGGGRESGSDSWKQYMRRATWYDHFPTYQHPNVWSPSRICKIYIFQSKIFKINLFTAYFARFNVLNETKT